jgi:hypothetical protein
MLLVDDSYLPWKYPLAMLHLPAAAGDCLWLGCFLETRIKNHTEYSNYGHGVDEATHLLIYRPAPFDDKNVADHDCWIGPFRGPAAGDLIFGVFNDGRGRLWATTSTGVYRIAPEAVLREGLPHGISTAEWRRQQQERRAKAPLAIRVRELVAEEKAPEAIALTEKRLAALGQMGADSPAEQRLEWSVVECLRALAQAAQAETKGQAVETDEQIITTDWADPVARIKATVHQIKLLQALNREPEADQAQKREVRLFGGFYGGD